jgi:hypothetical protein
MIKKTLALLFLSLSGSGALAQPTYDKVRAYVQEQGGDPTRVTRQVMVVKERDGTVITDWQVPGIPRPPDGYWDTVTEAQAANTIASGRQERKSVELMLLENRIMERLWEDSILPASQTKVGKDTFQEAILALVLLSEDPEIPPEVVNAKIGAYTALKTGVDMLGGDVRDIRYHPDARVPGEKKKKPE